MRWLLIFGLLCSHAQAQTAFPLERLGKFWESERRRPAADFGAFHFRADQGRLRIEGLDDTGTPWKVWLPSTAWVEAPVVYRADLDANGRQDLLIVSNHNGNGTCVEGGTITALMMDAAGRPVPWQAASEGRQSQDYRPEVLVDLDNDGKAELITSGCKRVDSAEAGIVEQRRLNGVYEADQASWAPFHPDSPDTYLAAARSQLGKYYRPERIQWEPNASAALDDAAQRLRVDGVMIEMYAGQRIRFSDGKTRSGLRGLILDGAEGRRIYLTGVFEPLLELLRSGAEVRVAGDEKRADFVWSQGDGAGTAANLALGAVLSDSKSTNLRLVEEWERPATTPSPAGSAYASGLLGWMDEERLPRRPTAPPPSYAPGDLYARDGRCAAVWAYQKQVRQLPNCGDLGGLEKLAVGGARLRTDGEDSWGGGGRVHSVSDDAYVRWLVGKGMHEAQSVVEFEPVPDEPGELVGVAERGSQWLTHWRSGGRNWLAFHDGDGSVVSGAMGIEIEGDLVSGRGYMLGFLRWEGGVPAERIDVRVDLEWRRVE